MSRILLIEDDDEIRTNVEEILESHGYDVFTAPNGKEGIKLANELQPNLILCDIMMPLVNGYEVLKSVSSNDETKHIPFIFLTAKVELSDIRTGMNLGADDYIVKPFRAKELLHAVSTRLDRIKTFKEDTFQSRSKTPASSKPVDRVMLTVNNKPLLIKFEDIKYIVADGEYTAVYMKDGSMNFVRKLLKNWNDALPENVFLRVHRATIINLEYVIKVEKWFNRSFIIYLKGLEEPIQVSQRFAKKIKDTLSI
ncbi:MAG: response regulator [Bacteroidetes bacterium]|nr:response regulator [Bacteroidota bacterium]